MYRRQGATPSPRKRYAKWLPEEALQIAEKTHTHTHTHTKGKGKIYPFECRVPNNSKDR